MTLSASKNALTKRTRRLQRDARIALLRNAERLRRADKHYNPHKGLALKHDIEINHNITIRALPGRVVVAAPEHLDFREHIEQATAFLQALRNEAIRGSTYNILIDLSALVEVSPAAGTVLLAEVTRCMVYTRKVKHLQGNYPKSDRAKQMLTDIGFFRAFQIRPPTFEASKQTRVYVKTISGNQSDGRYTRPLLNLFESVCNLHPLASKRLYGSLIECMDNVSGHAYPLDRASEPYLIGEWWMAGFADPVRRQLAIVFYDSGQGIPTTIKRKRSVRFKSYLNFTDSRILQRAVTTGLSSKANHRRGTGLPSLREFVDEANGGLLRLISGHGDVRYRSKKPVSAATNLQTPLAGSLIVWTINEDGGSEEAEEDLQPVQPLQLRLPYA